MKKTLVIFSLFLGLIFFSCSSTDSSSNDSSNDNTEEVTTVTYEMYWVDNYQTYVFFGYNTTEEKSYIRFYIYDENGNLETPEGDKISEIIIYCDEDFTIDDVDIVEDRDEKGFVTMEKDEDKRTCENTHFSVDDDFIRTE